MVGLIKKEKRKLITYSGKKNPISTILAYYLSIFRGSVDGEEITLLPWPDNLLFARNR
jgi:hypothetical protein